MEIMRSFESGNDIRQIISCSEQGRALKLLKRREETKARAEAAMAEIENETKKRKFSSIDQKFGGNSQADFLEEEFKKQTVGLVSKEEFMAKRKAIDEIIENAGKNKDRKIRAKRTVKTSTLSFQDDSDADELAESSSDDEESSKPVKFKKTFGKDPSIDTSFLYDADRELSLKRKKQELIEEYNSQQSVMKNEKLDVTYSYWDGSGHRRSATVEKGWSVGAFLAKCKRDLEKTDFPELRSTTLDSLMYVKEDLIIPHNVTFYDLIKERVQGKTGPLFHFDVHEDLSMTKDIRVTKDESHAGKIVDRKWYERNKHIFPASRWENYEKGKGIPAGVREQEIRSSLRG